MRIGIDLGGTKIEGILLDSSGTEIQRLRVSTPQGDYAATVRTIADLVGQLDQGLSTPPSVGVGIPGTVSTQTGLVKNANSVCLIGNPLDKDISEAIGRDVRLENDANCFAVSEAHDGAGAGAHAILLFSEGILPLLPPFFQRIHDSSRILLVSLLHFSVL